MATESWTTRGLRDWMRGFLQHKGIESAPACADLLLAHVAGCERMHLYMEPERPWTADELATLRALVARAGRHEPVQFLVGSWGFHAADFEVAPCTLIPRPSTEALVDAALGWLVEQPVGSVRSAIDLGTGTGCIALSILRALRGRQRKGRVLARAGRPHGIEPSGGSVDGSIERDGSCIAANGVEAANPTIVEGPGIGSSAAAVDSDASRGIDALPHFVLTDLVPEAVELARRNAARHGLADRCLFRVGDAWAAIESSAAGFDLVVSNPPYISDAEFAELAPNVAQWEPRTALHGGADGLDVVERIVQGAMARMRPGALLLVEIAASQERAAVEMARSCGFREPIVLRDSDDLPRVLRAVTPA
jgi:release factor glutamine methyltransferase